MKIAFVWTGLSGYMGDCWRKLTVADVVELKAYVVQSQSYAKQIDFRADDVLHGLDATMLGEDDDPSAAIAELAGWRADVIFAVGWRSKVCRTVIAAPELRGVPKVCCFDMPWRWQPRCLAAPLALRRVLSHYDAAYVPGKSAERYARWLGFRRIRCGLFSIDTRKFAAAPTTERGYFLYLGRDSSEKRLDILRHAHALYRKRGGEIPLRLHGKGLENGFAAPAETPGLLAGAKAVVLASDFDPWPLVLLEGMCAGCTVIASDRCQNFPELGKGWLRFRHGDAEALAGLFKAAETHTPDAEECRRLVQPYDTEEWSRRTIGLAKELI